MADAEDLKSSEDFSSCGFESLLGHQLHDANLFKRCEIPSFESRQNLRMGPNVILRLLCAPLLK